MKTKIEWCDSVWNVVSGCTKISTGCKFCYAERMSKRLAGRYGYPKDEPFKVTLHPDKLQQPLHWKKPRRIFVCSMSDLFHEKVDWNFQYSIFEKMYWCPQHTFLILTKRPAIMKKALDNIYFHLHRNVNLKGFLPNLHLGVSGENQQTADDRIPILLQIPAAIRFVSVEPMLSPVDLPPIYMDKHRYFETGTLDWVICGCESGLNRRECKIEWMRSLKNQCVTAGVPFFLKQAPGYSGGKSIVVKMPYLDRKKWSQIPGEIT